MADLLLGVDIGTGSTKGVLTTPDGTVVATAVRRHEMSLPRTGHHEMDAEAVWWDDVVSICRELVLHAHDGRVAGLCVSGIGPCLLPRRRRRPAAASRRSSTASTPGPPRRSPSSPRGTARRRSSPGPARR